MNVRPSAGPLLIIAPGRARGGCEEYMLRVVRGAQAHGWSVAVSLPYLESTASIRTDLMNLGAQCIHWDLGSDGDLEAWGTVEHQADATHRLMERVAPRAVLLTLPSPLSALGALGALDAAKQPVTAVFQLCASPMNIPFRARESCVLARERGQTWVAVSTQNRRAIATSFGVDPEYIQVISNGVDVPELPDNVARRVARLQLGVSSGQEVVLTVGRLTPQKGYEEWLNAIRAVARWRPLLAAWWAGSGEDDERMASLVRDMALGETVRLLGRRTDVSRLLTAADVFVMPSRFEGLPFALLEALAHGTPTVASEIEPHQAVITSGEHGLLASPAGLADAVQVILDNPNSSRRMAAAGRERVRCAFNASNMVSEVLRTLTRNLAGRASSNGQT